MFAIVAGLFTPDSHATTFYISPTATTDDLMCESGTSPAQAWRSLAVQYTQGCIEPGDTVIFLAGTYPALSPVFFMNRGRIHVEGVPGKPVTLKAEAVSGVPHPVRFSGEFLIGRSAYLIIDGIEFTRAGVAGSAPDSTENILSLGDAHDIVLRNVAIHGYANDHCQNGTTCSETKLKDCVKIDGGLAHTDFINIEKSKIYDCREDSIDITGRRGITLRNNEIYNARQIQIKGGAENIVLDNNDIHHLRYGVVSGGMDCTNDAVVGNDYCGSPDLVSLPAEERFQARNVIIKNNTLRSLELGPAVNPSGWQNVFIHDNRVIEGNNGPGALIEIRADFGWGISAYFDSIALSYCSTSPTPELCVASGTTPPDSKPNNDAYWRIRSKSKHIYVFRNSLHGRSALMLKMTTAVVEQNVCMFGNDYSSTAGGSPSFAVDGTTLFGDDLPTCALHEPGRIATSGS